MPPVITLLSDYGTDDEFVGIVHGVIAKLCPEARVIDVTHGIPRQAVDLGARALVRALPYMPAGVHLAVVAPEVGARRRAVALRVAEEGHLLVGPDNGLLIPVAERPGGVASAVEISSSPWRLEPVSATFHGRDLFAPVAARLPAGEALADAGTPLDPDVLVPLPLPPPRQSRWPTPSHRSTQTCSSGSSSPSRARAASRASSSRTRWSSTASATSSSTPAPPTWRRRGWATRWRSATAGARATCGPSRTPSRASCCSTRTPPGC